MMRISGVLKGLPLRRADVVWLVAIVALATLFLLPALLPGHTLLPLGLEGGIAPWNKQVDRQAQNLLLSDPFRALGWYFNRLCY
jgi:hypothetical protein